MGEHRNSGHRHGGLCPEEEEDEGGERKLDVGGMCGGGEQEEEADKAAERRDGQGDKLRKKTQRNKVQWKT